MTDRPSRTWTLSFLYNSCPKNVSLHFSLWKFEVSWFSLIFQTSPNFFLRIFFSEYAESSPVATQDVLESITQQYWIVFLFQPTRNDKMIDDFLIDWHFFFDRSKDFLIDFWYSSNRNRSFPIPSTQNRSFLEMVNHFFHGWNIPSFSEMIDESFLQMLWKKKWSTDHFFFWSTVLCC